MELYHGRFRDYQPFRSPQGVSGFVTGDLGMGHVVLPAPDLAASLAFYQQFLGFADTDGKWFELTPKVLDLGHAYVSSLQLPDIAQPFMEALSEKVHESVSASVLDGDEITILRGLDDALLHLAPGVLVTWNGSSFDLPFLADRAARLAEEPETGVGPAG